MNHSIKEQLAAIRHLIITKPEAACKKSKEKKSEPKPKKGK